MQYFHLRYLTVVSEQEVQKDMKTFIAGEGGPTKFWNYTVYPLILEGTIILNKQSEKTEQCEEPITELHELLHVFGFDHINDTESIMYPYLSCSQKIDQEYIDHIVNLYSIEPKSELVFSELNATKSGRYLNFNVSVKNLGIINSENAILKISSENDEIKEFELNDIETGSTKLLSVNNLLLPSRNTETISFEIITPTKEYNKENNIAQMNVNEA